MIREDFLQQNAFSKHDYTCPLKKSVRVEWAYGGRSASTLGLGGGRDLTHAFGNLPQVGMLRAIITFYEGAKKIIDDSAAESNNDSTREAVAWSSIALELKPMILQITKMQYLVRRSLLTLSLSLSRPSATHA